MVAVARRKNSDSALLRTVLLFCTCLPSYSWPRLRTGISVCAPAPSAHLVCAYPLAFVRRVPGSGQPQRPSTSQAHLSGRRPHANRQAKALARLQRDMVSNDHFERRGGITRARAVSPEMAHEKAEDEAQQLAAHQSGQREVLGHRWLLMRHGQTNYNADGRVQGSSDKSRLTDEGRRQVQAIG